MRITRVALVMVFVAGSAWAGEERFDFEETLGGGRFDKRHARLNAETPLDGKSSLEINTLADSGVWNNVWATPKGIFEPGKSYRVSFRARFLEKRAGYDQAHLMALLRPLSANHGRDDAGHWIMMHPGDAGRVSFRVAIPEGIDDYAFQFHTHFGLRALVDDVTITPARTEHLEADGGPRAEPPENLPAGAGEFTVEPPDRHNQKLFNAADFGVVPENADNSEAFRECVAQIRRQTPAKLVLDPGVYRFGGDKPLTFDAINNFEFDGGGATLLFNRSGGRQLVNILHCMNVEFRDFTIDWDWEADPLATVTRVESVAADRSSARLRRLDGGDFPRRDGFRAVDFNRLQADGLSPDHAKPLYFTMEFYKGQNAPKSVAFPEPGLLELDLGREGAFDGVAPGEIYRIRHYNYDINGINLLLNRHLTLENVHVASAPGMGILVGGRQHHWQFLRCSVTPPKGADGGVLRPISTAADAVHIGQSAGYFRMEGCEISHSADDALNIHDLGGFALRLDDRRLRATNLNYHPGNYYQKKDPVELREDDFAPTGFTGTLTEIKHVGPGAYDLSFDVDLPVPKGQGFVLYNRALGTRHVILRGNHIHDSPRGILLAADQVTVEGNRVENCQAAGIKIDSGYTHKVWSEGYGADNVVIRDNHFTRVNLRGRYSNENRPDIYINSYMGNDPSLAKTGHPAIQNILIAGNVFEESTGSPVFARTADGVTIMDNVFRNAAPAPVAEPGRAVIGVGDSTRVRVINNVWEMADPAWRSGVDYDPDTVTDIVAGGNHRR